MYRSKVEIAGKQVEIAQPLDMIGKRATVQTTVSAARIK